MSDYIKLVKNDTLPAIKLQVKDEFTNSPIDLSGVGSSAQVKFRAVNTTTPLSTITCAIIDGVNGIIQFDFSGGVLAVEPGLYEGEVQITFPGGGIQTLYDVLKFRVRDEF